ncbi:hypothetical protein PINS_up021879 [Pythium insidiosum]|nr:hypothetical protein PINS_up021878 [Pythium insidiosum]GLE09934.1 hypothetical protein PINS_up021879 [Pythium insidiosum]
MYGMHQCLHPSTGPLTLALVSLLFLPVGAAVGAVGALPLALHVAGAVALAILVGDTPMASTSFTDLVSGFSPTASAQHKTCGMHQSLHPRSASASERAVVEAASIDAVGVAPAPTMMSLTAAVPFPVALVRLVVGVIGVVGVVGVVSVAGVVGVVSVVGATAGWSTEPAAVDGSVNAVDNSRGEEPEVDGDGDGDTDTESDPDARPEQHNTCGIHQNLHASAPSRRRPSALSTRSCTAITEVTFMFAC